MSRPLPTPEEAERERSLVLLAEDHPVNRTVLVNQVNAVGFVIETADDGQEAIEAFRSGRYALVLTDLNMPRMDGFGLVAAIREHEAEHDLPRTPVLALTANVMQGEPERCLQAGMDDFIGKPTTIPFLASKLHRWLPHLDWPVTEPSVAVAAPEAQAGGDVLDVGVLSELTAGDRALADEVLDDFVAESRSDLATLREVAESGVADDVRRQAHRINGASRMVGAREVAISRAASSAKPAHRSPTGRACSSCSIRSRRLWRVSPRSPSRGANERADIAGPVARTSSRSS